MKRVAFLSFDWDFEMSAAYYEGASAYLEAQDDLQLIVFNAFGQYGHMEPEEGSLEIFSLCNLEDFDGLLIQGNQTWPLSQRQELAKRMRALDKPVVSMLDQLDGAHVVLSQEAVLCSAAGAVSRRQGLRLGYAALDALVRLMRGEQLPQQLLPGESLELPEAAGEDPGLDAALRHFTELLTSFQPAVLNADTLSGIMRECERYSPEMHCPRAYLTINDSYLSCDNTLAVTSYASVSKLMAQMGTDLPMDSAEQHVYMSFPTRSLLPAELPMEDKLYLVFPVRYNAICIGTAVIGGLSPVLRYGFLTVIISLLASAIENVRKKELLREANAHLDDLSMHDQLTGLFNRFGLERNGVIAYEHLLRDFNEAQFIFVDIDYLKQINDSYGHEQGDLALRDTAAVINRATEDENAFAVRYGGDEFLLICRRDLTAKLERELDVLKESCSRPFDLSLSIGAFRVQRQDHLTVQDAIQRADERMYQDKRRQKQGR